MNKIVKLLLVVPVVASAFPFTTKRWTIGGKKDLVDTVATDNGNIFFTRDKRMHWFRPVLTEDGDTFYMERDFPRTINRVSARKKSLLVNMSPPDAGCVSETMVFSKGVSYNVLWQDNTLFEEVVAENGYVVRANFFGNISYGNYEGIHTYNTRRHNNLTYTAYCVHDGRLWCATEHRGRNNTRITRVDAYDLHVKLDDGRDHMASVPDMTVVFDSRGCAHPCHLSVSVEKDYPKKVLYIVVGHMMGGVNIAQLYYPMEKPAMRAMCGNLPCGHSVRSLAVDMPHVYFLDAEGIHAWKAYSRMETHQFIGTHTLPKKHFSETTQIVAVKKQVFWNGEEVPFSVDVVEP